MRKVMLLGLALIGFSCSGEVKKNNVSIEKPNIILIMSDNQGWGDLSLNGNINISTPNIDAIAQNGVSFQNFYVQPVCSLTRAEC